MSPAGAGNTPGAPHDAGTSWLVLVHQLPSTPSNLRVRVWRRMQQVGAIALKQAVWVLPDRPACREDFEWLLTEITGLGGQATLLQAQTLDGWTQDDLVRQFRTHADDAYRALLKDVARFEGRGRRRRSARTRIDPRGLQPLRDRLAAIERLDFFGSAGREAVAQVLGQLAGSLSADHDTPDSAGVPLIDAGGLWVTRPRPGVDRMASAWLIRRFIDQQARFDFVADRRAAPPGSHPFDMFGVEFTHRDDRCTFEVLRDLFRIAEPAVGAIAAIVHDLDLKDGRFGVPAATTVGTVIAGLQLAQPDDHRLLDDGMRLFEGLYQSFRQDATTVSPAPRSRSTRPGSPRRSSPARAALRRPRR